MFFICGHYSPLESFIALRWDYDLWCISPFLPKFFWHIFLLVSLRHRFIPGASAEQILYQTAPERAFISKEKKVVWAYQIAIDVECGYLWIGLQIQGSWILRPREITSARSLCQSNCWDKTCEQSFGTWIFRGCFSGGELLSVFCLELPLLLILLLWFHNISLLFLLLPFLQFSTRFSLCQPIKSIFELLFLIKLNFAPPWGLWSQP